MSKNTRNFPKKDEQDLKETIKKLKSEIRKLKKIIKKLKEENDSLDAAWTKTEKFMKDKIDNFSLEDLIKLSDEQLKEHKSEKEEARKKWAKWRKENL